MIEKVDSAGPYQFRLFLIFLSQWFIAAFFALGTSFLYLDQKFDCRAKGLLTEDCQQTVCELSNNEGLIHVFFIAWFQIREKIRVLNASHQFQYNNIDENARNRKLSA